MGKKKKYSAKQKRQIFLENLTFLREKLNTRQEKVIMGLDFSLNHTGICIIDDKSNILHSETVEIKSGQDNMNIQSKLEMLFNKLRFLISDYQPDIVAYESVTAGQHFHSVKVLSFSNAVYFCTTFLEKPNFLTLSYVGTQLKKAAVGRGRGVDKKEIIKAHKDSFGIEFEDDNQADAFSACRLALKTRYFVDLFDEFCGDEEKTVEHVRLFEKKGWQKDYLIKKGCFEVLMSYFQSALFMEENDYARFEKRIKKRI